MRHPLVVIVRTASALIMVCSAVSACSSSDRSLRILAHRQEFSVELKSWTPRDGAIIAELQVVAKFEPRIDLLTVRVVSFDENGAVLASRRVALDVGRMQVGIPLAVRRQIELPVSGAALGVEVEASPPASEWDEFAELRDLGPPAWAPATP